MCVCCKNQLWFPLGTDGTPFTTFISLQSFQPEGQNCFPKEAGVSDNLSFMGTHTGRFSADCTVVLTAVSLIAARPSWPFEQFQAVLS